MKPISHILQQTPNISSELILELISYIDLTSLNKHDTHKEIVELAEKANLGYLDSHPAAICVFSKFAEIAADKTDKNIKTAVVCSNFPHGQSIPELFNQELNILNNSNIDEVDIINQTDKKITQAIIKSLYSKKVKTILETGSLTDNDIKRLATDAINAGSHFIKTSTGTSSIGYTPNALFIMCLEIKNHFDKTGTKVGIKPSGGIRTIQQAIEIHTIINHVLGEEWLTPSLFRIGTSSLYTNLMNEHKTRFT